MDAVIANVDNVVFDFEVFMKDSWTENRYEICKFYLRNSCAKGQDCTNRHVKVQKEVVCKHWLRGLCKKGSTCGFLHEYDLTKMPECQFFTNYGECSHGEDCPFLHIDPTTRVKECAWYNRGFCRHGPRCKDKHIKKVACANYLCGFCPDGPNCKFGHPKFDLNPAGDDKKLGTGPGEIRERRPYSMENTRCFACQQFGHIMARCPNKPQNQGGGGFGGGGGGFGGGFGAGGGGHYSSYGGAR